MKKIYFCVFFLSLFLYGCTPNVYRHTIIPGKGTFVVPPKVKFNASIATPVSKYYYLLFPGIETGFLQALANLKKAIHWSGDVNYFEKGATSKLYKLAKVRQYLPPQSAMFSAKPEQTFHQVATLENKKQVLFIQIDFNKILNVDAELNGYNPALTSDDLDKGSSENLALHNLIADILSSGAHDMSPLINLHYETLSKELMTGISALEGIATDNWPNSISQSINERVFEMTPVLQESVLAGYGTVVNENKSFIMVSPKIQLNVENTGRFVNLDDPSQFSYAYQGNVILSFYRDKFGILRQNQFIELDRKLGSTTVKLIPDNTVIKKDLLTHLQASSSDLQLSSITSGKKYIALYLDYLKRNNSSSSFGNNNYGINADRSVYMGNSMLLLADKPGPLLEAKPATVLADKSIVKSVFACSAIIIKDDNSTNGCRSLITPVYTLYVNSIPHYITAKKTLSDVISEYNLPEGLKLTRVYNGKALKFTNPLPSTILLPGDHLKF